MLSKNTEQLQWTTGRLDSSAFVLFIQYFDYNTSEWNRLRSSLSDQGFTLKVIKTSKLKKALESTSYGSLSSAFSGPMAIVFAKEEIPFSSIKSTVELFKKETKVQIVGGVYNKAALFPSKVKELAASTKSRGDVFRRNWLFTNGFRFRICPIHGSSIIFSC